MSSAISYVLGAAAAAATFLVARRLLSSSPRRALLPDCATSPQAVGHGGTRALSSIRMIVIHSTEGDTASGAAGWFAMPGHGSAHAIVDDGACYAPLADEVVPYGAAGCDANVDGYHIEIAGWSRWSREQWLDHPERIDAAAALAADRGRRYGIPMRRMTAAQIASGDPRDRGIATHAEITEACGVTGDGAHRDPGPGFPMDRLIEIARAS